MKQIIFAGLAAALIGAYAAPSFAGSDVVGERGNQGLGNDRDNGWAGGESGSHGNSGAEGTGKSGSPGNQGQGEGAENGSAGNAGETPSGP